MVFCSVTMVNFTQQLNVIGYLLEISSIEKFNAIKKIVAYKKLENRKYIERLTNVQWDWLSNRSRIT